jgi:hypothetical protein
MSNKLKIKLMVMLTSVPHALIKEAKRSQFCIGIKIIHTFKM